MAAFERAAPNFRFAQTHYGDTLKSIALRELGDASRWVELVLLNDLKPPYIVNDPRDVSAGVLVAGDAIRVPAAAVVVQTGQDYAALFGRDIALTNGQLRDDGMGDLMVVEGIPNLKQALVLHVTVDKRELGFHPEFGCHVRSVLGAVNGPVAAQLAAFYVKSAILEDPRVDFVESCEGVVEGDRVHVTARVVPVSSKPVDIKVVI